jgi:hypothetical protein
MSFPNDRTYSFDKNLEFSDGGTYTATGFLQVGGANAILDLGGNQGTTPVQQSRIDAVAVCDVTAITVSGTQTYKLMVLGSNDAGMATGNVCLGEITLGKGTSIDGTNMADGVTGRYEIMFSTNVAGSLYQFVAVYLVAANTPSITIEGFIAVLPEP